MHRYDNYVCSGYFPDKAFRSQLRERVYNLDLQDLIFEDNCMDVVISSDTMEHIPDPDSAFREIFRILKPGGFHCFTIPYHPDQKTTTRAYLRNGENVFLTEPCYHHDPYMAEGCLAYTDFGYDLVDNLNRLGFKAELYEVYDKKCDIHNDLSSMPVFVARKPPA